MLQYMRIALNVELKSHPNTVDETIAYKYSKYVLTLNLINHLMIVICLLADLGYKLRP